MGALRLFVRYRRLRTTFKWLTLALAAYVVAGVLARPDWLEVLRRTVFPGIGPSRESLTMFVAVFGTTISPYLFMWQSAEEVEEKRARGEKTVQPRAGASEREIREAGADTITGMTLSQGVGFFIMMSAGAVLYPSGVRDVGTAREPAQALGPIDGGIGTWLFTVGFIGTGMLAVPTLAGGAAYAVAALGGWRASIDDPVDRSRAFHRALLATLPVATGLALSGISPVALLFGSAVVNGMLTPLLLVLVLLITNDERIMPGRTNGRVLNALGVLTLLIMAVASLWLGGWWLRAALGG